MIYHCATPAPSHTMPNQDQHPSIAQQRHHHAQSQRIADELRQDPAAYLRRYNEGRGRGVDTSIVDNLQQDLIIGLSVLAMIEEVLKRKN